LSSGEIHHLLRDYGIALVFAAAAAQALGVPIPGTTVLIVAAVYAAAGHGSPIAEVIAAGALGAVAGMSAGFWIGRHASEERLARAARRLRVSPDRVARLRGEVAARAGAWVFFSRFVTGLRNVTGLLAGASGMPFGRFLRFGAAAALVWATSAGLEYYWFGRAVVGAPTWLQIVLVCLGLIATVLSIRFVGRRASRHVAADTASASEG
jgi:membrane protein DedA with SNARE-associated domain